MAKHKPPAGALKSPTRSGHKVLYNVWLSQITHNIRSHRIVDSDDWDFSSLDEYDHFFDNYFHAYAYFRQLQLRGCKVHPSSCIKG